MITFLERSAIPDGRLYYVNQLLISNHELYLINSDATAIYKNSLDGKTKWQLINHNLPNLDHFHIYGMVNVYDPIIDKSKVFLATSVGVYFSQDGGQSWLPENNGLPRDVIVTSIIAKGTHLIIGTANQGLFYSLNCGLSWKSAGNLPTLGIINSLGANKNYIFASAPRGLYKIDKHEVGF